MWAALAPRAALVARVYLEIFSGSGRLAAAFGREGELVLKWDVLLGPAYDLTKRPSVMMIVGWIRAGHIRGVHLGTPSTRFSRTQGMGIGPPLVRSSKKIGDFHFVAAGNQL